MLLVRISSAEKGWFVDANPTGIPANLHFTDRQFLYQVLDYFITHYQSYRLYFKVDGELLNAKRIQHFLDEYVDYIFKD
jgi:hypothetical protein